MKFTCVERGQTILREVTPFVPSPETALEIYDKVKDKASMFSLDGRTGPKALTSLLNPAHHFWLVDDVGLLCVASYEPGMGHAHITFWDCILRGREELVRSMARQSMRDMKLSLLYTAIPAASRATLAFAKRIGFKISSIVDGNVLLTMRNEAL